MEAYMIYELEIKQTVDYPRCRIYREFIRTLMKDKNIRTCGSSYLFYYMALCSYANFRSSYRKVEGISYLLGPGEWICKTSELSDWFRTKYQHQAFTILEYLQKQNYITYTKLGRKSLIKFTISNWPKYNTALGYNYPCQKDQGFFFFPISLVHELISIGKCSEMDIILDLWIHTIYNDDQVQGSNLGPVVYFRDCTGNPLTNFSDLSLRWGISKSTVSRALNKLQDKEYISLMSFAGRHGSVIYLRSYLSTMFSISDVMIDKEEVSMAFQVSVNISENIPESEECLVTDEQIQISSAECVLKFFSCVSKSDIKIIVQKVARILAAQGISCCECSQTLYKLYPLSDCRREYLTYILRVFCPDRDISYQFELYISPQYT